MHWRLGITEWAKNMGEGNKAAMRALAEHDTPLGVVACPAEPVAGCKAGPYTARTRIAGAFLSAGATEIVRPRSNFPIMRYELS